MAGVPSSSRGSSGTSFPFTTVTKSADQSIANNSVAALDSALFFTGVLNAWYEIVLCVIYGSPAGAGTPDIKIALAEDTTFRGNLGSIGLNAADSGYFNTIDSRSNVTTGFGTAAADRAMYAWGEYGPAGGGSIGLWWAQNTSGANATIVRAGSFLRYLRTV